MKTRVVLLCLLLVLLIAAPAFAGGWLIYHDGPYTGKIVDAETGEPIEGAAVVGIWDLEIYGGAGGALSRFFDANETVTDKNGDFEISSTTGFYWWPFSKLGDPSFIIYKPGYDSYPPSLPIVTDSFTKQDWDNKHNYQLEYWVKIYKNNENIIKLKKASNEIERKWIESGVSLIKIPKNMVIKKANEIITLINNERRSFGFMPIYKD